MITVTERAKSKAVELMTAEIPSKEAFIRVGVEGGGCSGLSYTFAWEKEARLGDEVFEGPDGARIYVLRIPPVPRAALLYQRDRAVIHRCLRQLRPDLVQAFGTESSFGYAGVTWPGPSVLMIQGIVAELVAAQGWTVLASQPGLSVALLSRLKVGFFAPVVKLVRP